MIQAQVVRLLAFVLTCVAVSEAKLGGVAKDVLEDTGVYESMCGMVNIRHPKGSRRVQICTDGFKGYAKKANPDFDYDKWVSQGKEQGFVRLIRGSPAVDKMIRAMARKAPDNKIVRCLADPECQVITEEEEKVDDEWADLQVLARAVQSATQRKSKPELRAAAAEILRILAVESNYFVAYEANSGQVLAGSSPAIVRGKTAHVNTKIHKRSAEKHVTLDRKVEGTGCIYTGAKKVLEGVVKPSKWDPRYPMEGEIVTEDGKLRLTKKIPEDGPKDGILKLNDRPGVFTAIGCDEMDLATVAQAREVKILLADPVLDNGQKKLEVKAIITGDKDGWAIEEGDPSLCLRCLTAEMTSFLRSKDLLHS